LSLKTHVIRLRSFIWQNKPTPLDRKSLNKILLMQNLIPMVICYLTSGRAHLRNFVFAQKSFHTRTGCCTFLF